MTWPDLFLLSFVTGTLWAVVSLALGGLHVGHLGHVHVHAPGAHGQAAHTPAGKGITSSHAAALISPSALAVFLAWFGGAGYLLTRYSGWLLWINLLLSGVAGLGGALFLASFLQFLQAREKPLNPLDYEMVGTLGQVSSSIRPGGVGEVLYVREGVRRCVPARSEDGLDIGRGREVIVTHYDRGIAYVRTWESMTRDELQ